MIGIGGHGVEILGLLLLALAIDAYVGELPFLFRYVPHPVVLIGNTIGWFDRRLNRITRGERDRFWRGVATAAILTGAAVALGLGLQWLSTRSKLGLIVALFLMVTLVAQRSLYDHVEAVRRALAEDGLAAARIQVSRIVGRDPNQLDEHGVARAAIESLAENFSDGVVAPVLWTAVFGLPGLFLYKTANTLDSMIGHRSPRYEHFGKAAARLDDALNLVPARLSGLIIASAALFAPGARPLAALATMGRDAGSHRSVNAGWPEAAMAGALGLALAGPRRYPELVVNDPWIGGGRARATHQDIRRALNLYVIACLIDAGLVAALLTAALYLD
ncbi:MAG: cobalamin biosynthesis protein CobD [Proteobacteria bacterium]|nr:cobalamin biosynthesis protein CobD [Pseudomonadota bacterium]